jgi:hypothetical protein
VESAPRHRLSKRVKRPFDLVMKIGLFGTAKTTLPVSLERLELGHFFAVVECFQSLLCPLDHASGDREMEKLTSRELTLSGDGHLCNDKDALEKVMFSMWILAAYQWQANVDYLQDMFRQLRFDALTLPGMRTYLPLIQLRQLIVGMRDSLPRAQQESRTQENRMGAGQLLRLSIQPSNLSEILCKVAGEIETLDKELNDEIHLIIGAVTVQDSDANKVQTERAILLTALAAIYLPLTLVTGIFGMNIKDINDGSPSWRACGIVLAVMAFCTMIFVLAYREWRRRRRGRQERKRMELGFRKDV